MRKILFRGRDKRGTWHYGDLVRKFDVTYIVEYLEDSNSYEYVEVAPETVGQFVGVASRNGKMIFEGDVMDSLIRGVVVFECGNFGFKDHRKNRLWSLGRAPVGGSIVIGNIHDNPELMEAPDEDK